MKAVALDAGISMVDHPREDELNVDRLQNFILRTIITKLRSIDMPHLVNLREEGRWVKGSGKEKVELGETSTNKAARSTTYRETLDPLPAVADVLNVHEYPQEDPRLDRQRREGHAPSLVPVTILAGLYCLRAEFDPFQIRLDIVRDDDFGFLVFRSKKAGRLVDVMHQTRIYGILLNPGLGGKHPV